MTVLVCAPQGCSLCPRLAATLLRHGPRHCGTLDPGMPARLGARGRPASCSCISPSLAAVDSTPRTPARAPRRRDSTRIAGRHAAAPPGATGDWASIRRDGPYETTPPMAALKKVYRATCPTRAFTAENTVAGQGALHFQRKEGPCDDRSLPPPWRYGALDGLGDAVRRSAERRRDPEQRC